MISVPSGITQVEKRAVQDSALRAGASEVFIIEQAMARKVDTAPPMPDDYVMKAIPKAMVRIGA